MGATASTHPAMAYFCTPHEKWNVLQLTLFLFKLWENDSDVTASLGRAAGRLHTAGFNNAHYLRSAAVAPMDLGSAVVQMSGKTAGNHTIGVVGL